MNSLKQKVLTLLAALCLASPLAGLSADNRFGLAYEAAVLFAKRVCDDWERNGGDDSVRQAWKEELLRLGMESKDLVGKFPPRQMYDNARAKLREKTPSVEYHSVRIL